MYVYVVAKCVYEWVWVCACEPACVEMVNVNTRLFLVVIVFLVVTLFLAVILFLVVILFLLVILCVVVIPFLV